MLRFETSEKFVSVVRVFRDGHQIGRIANRVFEPYTEQDEYDAAELRQIAAELVRLNGPSESK